MPDNNPIPLAICDTNATRRAALATRATSVEFCASLDALREHLRCRNAVLIAEPCPSLTEMESLFAVAKESGRQFAVLNPDRYLPSRQLIRKQLAGPLGEAGLVRVHRWEPVSGQSTDIPEPLLRDIDMVLWLVGRQPDRVFTVEQKPDPSSSGRYMQVHLGFASGAMALLDFSSRLPPGDGYQSLSVIASAGAAYADDHQNTQLLYRGGHPQAVRTEEHAAIARAIGDGLPTDTAAEWRNVFAVADAVRKSLVTKQAVALEGR